MSASLSLSSKQFPRLSLSAIRDVVARCEASGMRRSDWCRAEGINRATLQWYMKRVRLAAPTGFIAVRQRGVQSTATEPTAIGERVLVLECGRGVRVTGLCVADVAALLRSFAEVAS